MSRVWRTVFHSKNKRVLVRGGGAGQSKSGFEWIWLLWLALGAYVLYAVVLAVMAYWPWLLGLGVLAAAWKLWSVYRHK